MPSRFFRRVRIAPGVRVNFSKSLPSVSLGVRGAHVTVGHHRRRATVGIPGTGLFYTKYSHQHARAAPAAGLTQRVQSVQSSGPSIADLFHKFTRGKDCSSRLHDTCDHRARRPSIVTDQDVSTLQQALARSCTNSEGWQSGHTR